MSSLKGLAWFGIISLSGGCSLETQTASEITSSHLSEASSSRGGLKPYAHREGIQERSTSARLQGGNEPNTDPRQKLLLEHKESIPVRVEVERLSVARDVKQRRVIGESDQFPHNIGSIWSLAEVYAYDGTAELEMRWWRGDHKVSISPFLVSEGLRWREWSKLNIRPSESGAWRVEVYQPRLNRILMSREFFIKAANDKETVSEGNTKQGEQADSNQPDTVTGSQAKSLDLEQVESLAKVQRLQIARQIKRRRPIDSGSRFSLSDERLWGYIEVSNLVESRFVWMEWYHEDTLRSKLKVRLGVSKRWRTWSWQRLSNRDQGQWSVKVLSEDNHLLAETHFIVVE